MYITLKHIRNDKEVSKLDRYPHFFKFLFRLCEHNISLDNNYILKNTVSINTVMSQ